MGLKGTDGLAQEALARGARPLAAERAKACLALLARRGEANSFLTASGEMGEEALMECGLSFQVVYHAPESVQRNDTRCRLQSVPRTGQWI